MVWWPACHDAIRKKSRGVSDTAGALVFPRLPMKVLLAGLGSAGDVFPFFGLAQDLMSRGHVVELLVNPVHAPVAAAYGLPMHPVGTVMQVEQTLAHPKLWHPVDGLGVMWRYLLRPAVRPVFDRIRQVAANERCVVVATPLAFGARVAQESLGVTLISAYTAATLLRSCENPQTIAQWQVPRWLPRPVRSSLWNLLDRYKLEPLVRPELEGLRASLGLPDIRHSIFGEWMHSPDAGCTLFPAWFAKASSDWPPQVVQAGFPLFESDPGPVPDARLATFLESGARPVVFTAGTAARQAGDFFRLAVSTCLQLGVRGVLVGHGATEAAGPLPAAVTACDHVPFHWLFPQAAAVVHHGGIGTLAQALKAGIPQLVLPRAYDQFDNGLRIRALRVGDTLGSADAMAELPGRLRRLLDDPLVQTACRSLAHRVDTAAARRRVSELVESFA